MRRSLLTLFCFLFASIVNADQIIVEPDAGRAPVLAFINQTQHHLNLVMYDFTDKTILNALLQKQRQGKNIRVILEKTPYKNEGLNLNTIATLNNEKLNWKPGASDFQYTHQKTMVSDDTRAMIMTFNFTLSSFKNQRNFAILIDDPTLIQDINHVFDADWQAKTFVSKNQRLLFSPHTSRRGYQNAIALARHSIHFYAQTVADPGIIQSLLDRANHGVTIKIITSKLPKKSDMTALEHAGVELRLSKKLYIHAKAMLIDEKTAIIGSVNFTPTSLDRNRELAILSTDPSVTGLLKTTFTNDWNTLSQTNARRMPALTRQLHPSKQLTFTPNYRQFKHFVKLLSSTIRAN